MEQPRAATSNARAAPAEAKASGAQTLERGLDLLEAAVLEPRSAQALADHVGVSRSIAYRLLGALVARGFLSSSGGQVRAGRRLVRLGHLTAERTDLLTVARVHLVQLAATTGLCAFMGRRDGDESVHMLRIAGSERVAVTTPPGTRRRLAETGLGKALLLDDDDISWRRLFGLAAEPHRPEGSIVAMRQASHAGVILQFGPPPDSIRSVAAPIRDASGTIVAAINVAAAAQYLDESRMLELAPVVTATACALSREIGWEPAAR